MSDELALLEESLRTLSGFFVGDGTLGETLLKVAQLACEATPADMAGITMLADGRPATVVYTDPEAPQIDTAQYETGTGPCLEAFRDQQVCRIDSTADDGRWPDFGRHAAAHGIRATLSVPLAAAGQGLGALNLYSRSGAFSPESVRQGEIFAASAVLVLANVRAYRDARQLSENMYQAMKSRAVIDQAIGIMMARGGISPEEAFQLLTCASQRQNRKLRDIAAGVVDHLVRQRGPSRG
jgi:GAF domain-containing protein